MTPGRASTREDGIARRERIRRELGDEQGGVASLAQLREHGVTYDQTRAEVAAGRWHRVGRRTISLTGPLPSCDEALWRRAIWDTGGGACLDGVSALMAWGLQGWTDGVVHVSVEARARYHKVDGVRAHVLRDRGRVVTAGVPRTPPEVAALRAAMWARSDRAAATLLAMAVQQRLVDARRLLQAWRRTGRCPRRRLLSRLVPLVAGGAHALSEIDLAELCRARGLPEPDRQAPVQGPQGQLYLDVRFTAYGVVVEVNGVQHYEALATVDDALRRNEHAIGERTALEVPAVALVLDPEPFLDQVETALRRAGWAPEEPETRPGDKVA